MVADRAAFFNVEEFGSTATYTDGDGSESEVSVVVTYSEDLAQFSAGNSQAAFAIVEAQKAQVPNPRRYDKFVIDGVTWQVENQIQSDDVHVLIRLSKDQRMA